MTDLFGGIGDADWEDLSRALLAGGDMDGYPSDPTEADLIEALGGRSEEEIRERQHVREVISMGSMDSNWGIVRPDGSVTEILGKGKGQPHMKPDGKLARYGGMAAVQVNVSDFADAITPVPSVLVDFQQRLILSVSWQTATGGGSCEVDASQGCVLALGGSHAIQMNAQILSPDSDTAAPAAAFQGPALKVEVVILWQSSGNPKPNFMTRARSTFAGPGVGPFFRVPPHANGMLAQTTVPAGAAGLTASFFSSDIAAGPALQNQTLNPVANGTIITSSMRFCRFTAAAAQIVTPVFELNV